MARIGANPVHDRQTSGAADGRAAGLISRSRTAQWRSSSLEPEPLREATAWMERYREFWDTNFERLDAHLQRIQRERSNQEGTPS